jgi:hypothetical protein
LRHFDLENEVALPEDFKRDVICRSARGANHALVVGAAVAAHVDLGFNVDPGLFRRGFNLAAASLQGTDEQTLALSEIGCSIRVEAMAERSKPREDGSCVLAN